MTIQITIVGLDQIGASIGLGLVQQEMKFQRTGIDRSTEATRKAQKMGAIDQVATNLASAVRGADIVMLCEPPDEVRQALEIIAGEMKENAVVMDTSPMKVAALGWANELLPENRHYVGLTPVINPNYVLQFDKGLDAARADLFQRGLFAIVAPPRTSGDALTVAANLVKLLGADALFADPYEIDGLMAATHTLPQLMAAALILSTVEQPGWREGRKIAGQPFAQGSAPSALYNSAKAASDSALLNRENVLRMLDGAIAVLEDLRQDLDQNDAESLEDRLEQARQALAGWIKERMAANWAVEELPDTVAKSAKNYGVMTRLFGTGWKSKDRK